MKALGLAVAAASTVIVLLTAGCSQIILPPTGGFDYQLGGSYSPPTDTKIVARDSTAAPENGYYNICYLNGFQSQPGQESSWENLLLTKNGLPVADPEWPDEYLFDTSNEANRQQIAEKMVEQINGCAQAGFDAVEFDNLDSYLRSAGSITAEDNLELGKLYISAAHQAGMAVGQKNSLEIAAEGSKLGFDFAVTEECGAYGECEEYLQAYQTVLDIEYADEKEYLEMCEAGILPQNSIRRDIDLTTPNSPQYVFQRCN